MKKFLGILGVLIVFGAGFHSGAPAFAQASFEGLGDLPGGSVNSQARAVSADGLVVVGWSSSGSGQEAFRWTQAGGMVGLGDFPGGEFGSQAYGVSADGSVVVSFGAPAAPSFFEAFRWTSAGGMVGLGDLPGGRSNRHSKVRE